MNSQGFSDFEVEQIILIVHEEFKEVDGWTVSGVERRLGTLDVVDLHIENELDHRQLTLPITCADFPGGSFPNGSQLTDAVFDISISLMEFRHIRGFDEFEDGAIVPILETYPKDRQRSPDLSPGVHRRLVSPFWDPSVRSLPEPQAEDQDS